jgi:hypothetical protein
MRWSAAVRGGKVESIYEYDPLCEVCGKDCDVEPCGNDDDGRPWHHCGPLDPTITLISAPSEELLELLLEQEGLD